MRTILAGTIVAFGVLSAAPVMAQGVYVGPNGVGVDTGARHYDDQRYDRDDYYRHRRDRDGDYEGRSAYDRDSGDRD